MRGPCEDHIIRSFRGLSITQSVQFRSTQRLKGFKRCLRRHSELGPYRSCFRTDSLGLFGDYMPREKLPFEGLHTGFSRCWWQVRNEIWTKFFTENCGAPCSKAWKSTSRSVAMGAHHKTDRFYSSNTSLKRLPRTGLGCLDGDGAFGIR